jgi:hypothetical protein
MDGLVEHSLLITGQRSSVARIRDLTVLCLDDVAGCIRLCR